MNAFDRYAPFIQNYIYKNHWESLRSIQESAAEVIFNTDQNLLLTASTASGKTEAAFFPIITLFEEDPPKSIGCLYIGPLKSLINDQFLRLNDICAEANIPIWRWHGDVYQSHKERLLKNPSGILQITPESLEALLLRKHYAVQKLFCDLRFIVIDEVHALMQGDRGGQTLCLIERLCRLANVNPRRIGLSATIGEPINTGKFLSLGTGRQTIIPRIKNTKIKWRISVEHFYIANNQAAQQSPEITDNKSSNKKLDIASLCTDKGISYIFEHTKNKKCILFVNSREECEAITTTLRRYCETKHQPDHFLIHHGNLSSNYRETTEELMRDETKNLTTVTTATLELGIDIGRLERAFQIDAPWTVSSFLQRIGRTGRRETPPEMWFVAREQPQDSRAKLPFTIPWKLIQAIALIQLYLEEKWVEPPRLDRLPYSLLYHQTMSVLASAGEVSPKKLAEKLLTLHYFHKISQEDYKALLRHLIAKEHIQQTSRGGLILGIEGEKIVNSFKFYGVFQENEEYTVRCESKELGTVVSPPPIGEMIAIAGHAWKVLEINEDRRIVYVKQVSGIVPAYFGECASNLHTKILERMKKVVQEDTIYPYLMKNATDRLIQARTTANKSLVPQKPLIYLGNSTWCLIPWLGTYAFLALERFLRVKCKENLKLSHFKSARPYFMQFMIKGGEKAFFETIFEEIENPIDPMELLYPTEFPIFEKYDKFVPIELIRKGFALGVLDIENMRKRVLEWKNMISY